MKVLIACEFSGTVRDAFAAKGHDAWSCDLLPTEKPGNHLQCDVRDILNDGWDLMIAHPPCTYLCNSGVGHLKTEHHRWQKMQDAARFFNSLLRCDIERICVENPVPHGYAMNFIGRKYTQIIHPWMFGHTEKKATCLWLHNLSRLNATSNVKAEMEALPKNQQQRLHYLPPSADRWKLRSMTYEGIALAMAEQWGNINEQEKRA